MTTHVLTPSLSPGARRSLRKLVAAMIPANARYGVPGADDDSIYADILATLQPQISVTLEALALLDELSGGSFADLDPGAGAAVVEQFRKNRRPGLTAIINATLQCYYRDERVMASLGMPARPAFPEGYELEQGDWTLLDPVRARAKIYKDA